MKLTKNQRRTRIKNRIRKIVSGTEAGGHCGEVSTMVLVPEVAEAVAEFDGVSILAAGGIVTGRQMAAAMAMEAARGAT